ncbi:WS/DGAT/MGAT family O-acyltransferase [Marinicella marina]|uniref:WS/DGAT/MGAT family O-acyltransferase n=1 Tax=Marinicella marina TaxID=2996016 RepID=UPI0024BCDBB2|nr:wax ester/triacylglycerol synthase family O-acyltransferase [Marinicella marina]MDJ1140744.1 wax ester/triacylglycerol synthase family O-acyltransferase [Marinicella marina]
MFHEASNKKEAMRKVDTAWLRMESPHNLMMITGLMFLDQMPDLAVFTEALEKKFLTYRRFKQLAHQSASGSYWQDDKYFDMAAHVRRVALPGKADYTELQDYVSNLASTPLDKNKPLWSFHIVENYEKGPVVVSRIHHCYADGIALIQVLLSMTSTSRESSLEFNGDGSKKEKHQNLGLLKQVINPAKKQFVHSLKLAGDVSELGKKILQDPSLLEKGVGDTIDIAEELFTALTLSDDPETVYKSELCTRKRVAWAQSIPLPEVKAIAKATGTTVNDVLISSLAGALREYMIERGDDPNKKVIRATVPVNLRPLKHAKELGNHFGLVFLNLPIFEENPLQRLAYVHHEMNELKKSKQALMSLGLLSLIGLMPQAVQTMLLNQFSKKATAVLTNVPGPAVPLYIAGCKVEKTMFWVPQNGTIGMGISILSYNDQVEFGLIVDKKSVPQPHQVIVRFPEQFARLRELMMLHPWDGEVHADLFDEFI